MFSSDVALQEAMTREGAGPAAKRLSSIGLVYGSAEAAELGNAANTFPPRLKTHDRNGQRCSRVDFHPAYHDLLEMGVAEGLHAAAWIAPGSSAPPQRHGIYVERAGCLYMAAQVDAGHLRAISMTHSAVPALSRQAELAASWLPKITSRSYDRSGSGAGHKSSLMLAFAIAEHINATGAALSTVAEPLAKPGPGALYKVTGTKSFVHAPTSDAFVVMAKTAKGPSCFLVPRFFPDDASNAIHIRRLNDTIGLRSSAMADLDMDGAQGWLLGDDGQGDAVINDALLHARLDTVIVAAGLMRQCLSHAIHIAEHTSGAAGGAIKDPLMHQTLADMALDTEAASALGFRLARAFDRATDARAAAWRRLMTPASMYWVSRRATAAASEAIDCSGGIGCLEDWPLVRPYRDVAMVAMAEGTASMMALDVLHILQREPDVAETVMEELGQAVGADPHLKAAHARIEAILHEPRHLDARGRLLVDGLATLAAGTILRAHGPAAVADAFIMTRMGNQPRQSYGQGLDWADTSFIVRRASPNQH